jgi:Uma2 family endonuclease
VLTFLCDMRVQLTNNATDNTRPDVVVRCGALDATNHIIAPSVVIEVLSPSTIDTHRRPKLEFYKLLPTIRHIVLVYQDQMRVEHYRRGEPGFEIETLKRPGDVLHLEAVDFRVDLARVHFGVTL